MPFLTMEQDAEQIIEVLPPLERLFLHFFDMHFLEEKGRAVGTKNFRYEIRLATRLAVASAGLVLVPAASYFESPICRETIDDLSELVKHGLIMLVGSSTNLEEFIRERQDERFYRKSSVQYGSYQRATLKSHPAYQRKHKSTTCDIVNHWGRRVQNEDLQRLLRDAAGEPIPRVESRLALVPEELGGVGVHS